MSLKISISAGFRGMSVPLGWHQDRRELVAVAIMEVTVQGLFFVDSSVIPLSLSPTKWNRQ
jgi:hypothetical protein